MTQTVTPQDLQPNSEKNQIERAVIDTTARRFRPCARDFIIFRDYTQGRSDLWKLAEQHDLEYSTIWQIVRKVENWLADQTLYEIKGLRVRATSRADFLAQEAIDAWHLSKRDEITTTETDRAMKNGQVVDSTVQRRTSAGNPAFLAQARECLDMVLKIWGGYSPKQLELKDTSAEDAQRVGGRSAIEALQIRARAINEQMERLTVDGTAAPTETEEEPPQDDELSQ